MFGSHLMCGLHNVWLAYLKIFKFLVSCTLAGKCWFVFNSVIWLGLLHITITYISNAHLLRSACMIMTFLVRNLSGIHIFPHHATVDIWFGASIKLNFVVAEPKKIAKTKWKGIVKCPKQKYVGIFEIFRITDTIHLSHKQLNYATYSIQNKIKDSLWKGNYLPHFTVAGADNKIKTFT